MPKKRVSKGRIIKDVKKAKPIAKKIKKPVAKKTKKPIKDEYEAKSITVLEGLEAVRKRPGMYIGSTGPIGLHHLVWEIMDNAIDEAMAGFCTEIHVNFLPDHMVEVTDNGRGIPTGIHPTEKVSALEVVMTKLHAGGKFGQGGYKVSGGLHGVGVSVVNALSSYAKAEVYRDGKIWVQEYKNGGNPVKKVKAIGKTKKTGSVISFKPDETIFDTLNFEWKTIIDHIRQQAYLNKGVRIFISDKRSAEEKEQDLTAIPYPNPTYQFYFEGGIKSYVQHLNQTKELKNEKIFYVEKEQDETKIEIALQYTNEYTESVFAFTNNIHNPEGGTHLSGFRTALTRTLNSYARNKNIIKEKDPNLTGEDVREGLNAIISVKVVDPQFEGQTKAKLGNMEVKSIMDAVTSEALLIFLEENPKDAEGIIGKCLLAARARNAAKAARDTILRKGALEGFTLPGKLADCTSRNAEVSEIYIVEGDSAGGCWDGNTKIALVDGRDLSFKELIEEDKQGKNNYCYTMRDNGHIGIEQILHPRITKRNAEVIKIILDNNEELVCTPDHKFRLVNGEYIEAQNLTKDLSLAPLYKKLSKKEGRRTLDGYEMVFDPKTKGWIYTHLISDMRNLKNKVYKASEGIHRHHIDFNKLNNDPTNLQRLSSEDHLKIHYDNIKKTLHRPDSIRKSIETKQKPEFREKARLKSLEKSELFSKNAKKQWENDEYKEFMGKKYQEFYNTNKEYRKENLTRLNLEQKKYWSKQSNKDTQSTRVVQYFQNNPKAREELSNIARKQWEDAELVEWRKEETKKQWTDDFRKKRKKAYNKTYLNNSLAFARTIYDSNKDVIKDYDVERTSLPKRNTSIVKLETLINRFFQGNKQLYVQAVANYNHKIKSIKKIDELIDVYDIEVPNTHNFALASGIFVHNSAKQGRDRMHQAILPLRGKVLNVEKARLDKILANNELKSLIIALGTNIGEQFDIEKLRYHQIVIMTDADVDGSHIRTLLLTFFYRYLPTLIHNGHIYIAQPPLFSIKLGKELKYVYTEEEKETYLAHLVKTYKGKNVDTKKTKSDETDSEEKISNEHEVTKIGGQKVSMQRYKGLGEMNPEQLWSTTMNPETRKMKRVTVEDAELANQTFEILMGDEVAPRKKFIQTHAKQVSNLDV